MKSLFDFIQESMEVEQIVESDSKTFCFSFKDFEGADSMVDSIESIGNKNGCYVERVDDGVVKIKVKDKEKADKVIEALMDFINAHQNDEGKEGDVEKFQKELSDMQDFMDEDPEGDEPKDDPKEDGEGE